jgi:hypothetical protein
MSVKKKTKKKKRKANNYQVGQVGVLEVLVTLLQDLGFKVTDSVQLTTKNR